MRRVTRNPKISFTVREAAVLCEALDDALEFRRAGIGAANPVIAARQSADYAALAAITEARLRASEQRPLVAILRRAARRFYN